MENKIDQRTKNKWWFAFSLSLLFLIFLLWCFEKGEVFGRTIAG